MSVTEARADFSGVAARAKNGTVTMVYKNSKPEAAVVSPEIAEAAPFVIALLREFGISLEMSRDEDLLAAYRRGLEEVERGDVVWEDI